MNQQHRYIDITQIPYSNVCTLHMLCSMVLYKYTLNSIHAYNVSAEFFHCLKKITHALLIYSIPPLIDAGKHWSFYCLQWLPFLECYILKS